MAIKIITSSNPFKKVVVKTFKDKFSATKITIIKFNTNLREYSANCFQKFTFLGNKKLNAADIYENNYTMEDA